jgi:hypothetical protein
MEYRFDPKSVRGEPVSEFRVVEEYGLFEEVHAIRWKIQHRPNGAVPWETAGVTYDIVVMQTAVAHIERTGRLETIYLIEPKDDRPVIPQPKMVR